MGRATDDMEHGLEGLLAEPSGGGNVSKQRAQRPEPSMKDIGYSKKAAPMLSDSFLSEDPDESAELEGSIEMSEPVGSKIGMPNVPRAAAMAAPAAGPGTSNLSNSSLFGDGDSEVIVKTGPPQAETLVRQPRSGVSSSIPPPALSTQPHKDVAAPASGPNSYSLSDRGLLSGVSDSSVPFQVQATGTAPSKAGTPARPPSVPSVPSGQNSNSASVLNTPQATPSFITHLLGPPQPSVDLGQMEPKQLLFSPTAPRPTDKAPQHLLQGLRFEVSQASVAPGPPLPMIGESAVLAANLQHLDEETGLSLPSPLALFIMYDVDHSHSIGLAEFMNMLIDLDGLKDVPQKEADKYCKEQFDDADLNHDGVISIDEWYFYFYKELCFKFPVLRTGINPGADLYNIFVQYCSVGKSQLCEEMASNQFTTLCKDAKLINVHVKRADLDIIYCRAKAETEVLEVQSHRPGAEYTTAKMYYPQFLFALVRLAEKRRSGFQEVVGRILDSIDATPNPSQADLVIFHATGDPEQLREWIKRPRGLPVLPRTVTSSKARMLREAELARTLNLPSKTPKKEVYPILPPAETGADNRMGAPETLSTGASLLHQGDPNMMSTDSKCHVPAAGGTYRQPWPGESQCSTGAHVLGDTRRRQWGLDAFGSPESIGLPCVGRQALNDPAALLAVRKLNPDHVMMALKKVFERYNVWSGGTNKGAMDKIRFSKIMRDSLLVSELGTLSSGAADSIFSHALHPAQARLNFLEFVNTLRHVATKLRWSLNEVMEKIVLIHAPLTDIS